MNTNNTVIARMCAVAVVTAFAGLTMAVGAGTPTTSAANVPVDHMGPGAGSVKTAPFLHIDASGVTSASGPAMSFHVDANQSLLSTSGQLIGPGQGSVKAPGIH